MFSALLVALVLSADETQAPAPQVPSPLITPPAVVEQPADPKPVEAVAAPPQKPARDDSKLRPLGLTVSGGVSLGTWEAGFVYFLTEAEKHRPTSQLRIVTGASAGSANALVAAIQSCQPPNRLPMSSLGWNVWGPVGFEDLFDRKRADADALFVRDELERSFDRVREVWKQGLPKDCDVVFGATVTRVKPREVKLKEGLAVPRVLETFVVRIQGRGPGRAPKLSNYIEPDAPMPMPLLPFVDDEHDEAAADRNFTQLRSVIFASSAFPVAFAPTPIEYCLSRPPKRGEKPTARVTECRTPEFVDLFIDGGVFDNNPLRLAWSMADQHLTRSETGGCRWTDMLATNDDARRDMHFIYLDPDSSNFTPETVSSTEPEENGFLARLFTLSGGLIDSARARELSLLAREQHDVADRMDLAMGNLPKASEPLSAFMGFFETEFRRFDFYLGMYDAYAELSGGEAWKNKVEFERVFELSVDERPEWAPFLCIASMMEPQYAHYREACDDPELTDFRILLQVSIDRLYAACRSGDGKLSTAAKRYNHLCSEARRGAASPLVPHVTQLDTGVRHRRDDEDTFAYAMRLLGEYGFRFSDLGLPRGASKQGALAMRWDLDELIDAWSGVQPTLADRVLSRTAARSALNAIEFSPPIFSAYAVLGTMLEGGTSWAPFRHGPRWLQLHGAVMFNEVFSVITHPQPRFSTSFTVGPEVHFSFMSNAVVQPRLAVRGGVQLGVIDGLATQRCTTSDPRACTQPELDVVLTVSLLERLRVELVWQTYPLLYATVHSSSNVHLGVGVQFY